MFFMALYISSWSFLTLFCIYDIKYVVKMCLVNMLYKISNDGSYINKSTWNSEKGSFKLRLI